MLLSSYCQHKIREFSAGEGGVEYYVYDRAGVHGSTKPNGAS